MNARIILEFPQAPEAKELEQLIALAEKLNGVMVEPQAGQQEPNKSKGQNDLSVQPEASSNGTRIQPLQLGIERFPINLDKYAVKHEHFDAIARIFEDEPSAESLCEMLTP